MMAGYGGASCTIARPALFPARYRVPVGALESISLAGTSVPLSDRRICLIICMNGTKDEKSEADL